MAAKSPANIFDKWLSTGDNVTVQLRNQAIPGTKFVIEFMAVFDEF